MNSILYSDEILSDEESFKPNKKRQPENELYNNQTKKRKHNNLSDILHNQQEKQAINQLIKLIKFNETQTPQTKKNHHLSPPRISGIKKFNFPEFRKTQPPELLTKHLRDYYSDLKETLDNKEQEFTPELPYIYGDSKFHLNEDHININNPESKYLPDFLEDGHSIINHVIFKEIFYQPAYDIFQQQTQTKYTPEIRRKLMNFVVFSIFNNGIRYLNRYSCVLACNIFDRFSCFCYMDQEDLHTMIVACIFLAIKLEEIGSIKFNEVLHIHDKFFPCNKVKRKEVNHMERRINQCLDYNYVYPSEYIFYKRYTRAFLSHYIMKSENQINDNYKNKFFDSNINATEYILDMKRLSNVSSIYLFVYLIF